MYNKLAQNAATHKGSRNALLNFYYTFPYALLVHCLGNEAFLVGLYLQKFPLPSLLAAIVHYGLYITFPIFFMKQFMNVVQLYDSVSEIAEMDAAAAGITIGSNNATKSRKGAKAAN